jgi:hypothetical protein
VTLLGNRNDWVNMRQRLDLLPKHGAQAEHWSKLLVPIFDRFIAAFDQPDDEELKIFWETVCHARGEKTAVLSLTRSPAGRRFLRSGRLTASVISSDSIVRNNYRWTASFVPISIGPL